MATQKNIVTTQQPSKYWQFEQRAKVAVRNRNHESIKEPMNRGNRLTAIVAIGTTVAVAGTSIPILGPIAAFFLSLPVKIGGLLFGGLAIKGYKEALYNENTDKFVNMKIKKWQQNPVPSILAKGVGTVLKYGINGFRVVGGLAATAGLAITSVAGIATYGGALPALASTAILPIATKALALTVAAIGVANPVLLISAGVVAVVVGGTTAVKGKKIAYNIGNNLKNSVDASNKKLPANSNIIRRVSTNTINSVKGFGADVFNVASAKKLKAITSEPKKALTAKKALTHK